MRHHRIVGVDVLLYQRDQRIALGIADRLTFGIEAQEAVPVIGDAAFAERRQPGVIRLARHQDRGALVATLFMQAAANDLQGAAPGQAKEPSGERHDPHIDVTRYRRGGIGWAASKKRKLASTPSSRR